MSGDVTERRRRAPVLVVGVGSELRSDDAAGRRVAETIERRRLPGVEVRSLHQLTPELASAMADRRRVVIVDASVDVDEVTVTTVEASVTAGSLSHHVDVATLLTLAGVLATAPDEVVTVAIPAHDLALGTELSERCVAEVAEATDRVVALCQGAASSPTDVGHRQRSIETEVGR